MKICEIFASIQGESTYAGLPCVFVRTAGCNLRCAYCDTKYSYEGGEEVSIERILEIVSGFGLSLVELTGGEPLLQEEAPLLLGRLVEQGVSVLVETNGSIDLGVVPPAAVVIMDVKTPGSGMSGSLRHENLALLRPSDEVKFVLTGREDYEWAGDFITAHGLAGRVKLILSPAFGLLDAAELSRWIVSDRLPVRLGLQLHKYIFDPHERGV